tara:strand:+ start:2224 stop:2550 length:327 start_codon:yes stop_codon:yes gene_type:complete
MLQGMLKILEQARMQAVAMRSPVSAKFIKAFIDHGSYDATQNLMYMSGQKLRNIVWAGREEKKQKNCLNAMCNARVTEGKKRHVGSTVIDRNFPNRRWDKTSDVVFIG